MNEPNRALAQRKLAQQQACALHVDLAVWSQSERRGFELFAPLLAQVEDLRQWSKHDKDALAQLCRARLATREREYIRRMRDHDRLREALAQAAQRTEVRS